MNRAFFKSTALIFLLMVLTCFTTAGCSGKCGNCLALEINFTLGNLPITLDSSASSTLSVVLFLRREAGLWKVAKDNGQGVTFVENVETNKPQWYTSDTSKFPQSVRYSIFSSKNELKVEGNFIEGDGLGVRFPVDQARLDKMKSAEGFTVRIEGAGLGVTTPVPVKIRAVLWKESTGPVGSFPGQAAQKPAANCQYSIASFSTTGEVVKFTGNESLNSDCQEPS